MKNLFLVIFMFLALSSCAVKAPVIEQEIGYKKLYVTIREIYPGLKPDAMTDTTYKIPSFPAELLARFPNKKLPYIPNKRDCDDFVYMFKAWLAEEGMGDILAMDCLIIFQDGRRHRVIGFLKKGVIIFGDPKGGKISDYSNAVIKRIIL